jgi:hypothetical protein
MQYKVVDTISFTGRAPGQFTVKGKKQFAEALTRAMNQMSESGWKFEDKIGPMGQYLVFSRPDQRETK